ncbi:hypothetical protein MP228_001404 [Amoeboaphelidium protococcarum]|nr:hypothetical protein MP228_001404 [Amoeboaphelidium protococcarum]
MIFNCVLSLVLLQFVFSVDFPVDQINQFLDAVDQEPARLNVALQQDVGRQLMALPPQNGICVTNRLLELIQNTRVSDHLYALFVGIATSGAGRNARIYIIDVLKTLRQTRDVQWTLRCLEDGVCRLPSLTRYWELLLAKDSTSLALYWNQIMPTFLIMMALLMRFSNRPLNALAQLLVSTLYISFILYTTLLTMKIDLPYNHDELVVIARLMQMNLVLVVISISEALWIGNEYMHDMRRRRALGIPQGLFNRNNEVIYGYGTSLTRLHVNDHFVESHVLSAEDECLLCRKEFEASEIAKRPRCNKSIYLHNECLCEWLVTNPKCFICNTRNRYSEGPSGFRQFMEDQNADQAQRQEMEEAQPDEEQTENTI